MDSPLVQTFLMTAVLPAFAVAVLVFIAGGMKEPWRSRAQGLIFAAGFVAGAYLLLKRLSFPPSDAGEAFIWSAVLLSVFVMISPRALGPRYMMRGLFVLGLGLLLLWPLRASIMSPMNYRNLVAFFCLGLGLWSISEQSSGKVRPSTLFLLPLITVAALSLFMLYRSSASFSQLVTVFAALLGAMVVVGYFFPQRVGRYGFVPFISVFVVTFLAAALFYLDANPWHLIYLCLPFLILWIRDWLGFVPENPVAEALVLGGLSAAPIAYFMYGEAVKAGPLF